MPVNFSNFAFSPLRRNATRPADFTRSRLGRWRHFLLSGWVMSLAVGTALPSSAAEKLAIRFGVVQQSIPIEDLERFAQTGSISPSLSLYAPLLTADVQEALRSRLQLDPNVGDKLVEDLLHSSAGERFLNTLQVAIPDTNPTQLKLALSQAAKQPEGMSILGLLRSFPSQTVTIDATSAIALVSQMNLPYWQSQTLSSVLEQELAAADKPPRPESDPTRLDPTQTGPYWVWKQTLSLRDYQRDRMIPVDLYWSRRTQGPLVVLSHGFGADRRFLGYLAYHLASYGLTVVAVEHPASNVAWLTSSNALDHVAGGTAANLLPASEFVDRPKDISFVLDRLSQLDRFSSTLSGKFNTKQVTVIGHSLGGYTALALAGARLSLDHLRQFCNDPNPVMLSPADLLQCSAADLPDPPEMHDPRVTQTIILNPVIGRLFDAKSLAQVKVPTLMLSGTDDPITPAVSQQLLPFTELKAPKFLLTAIGGTHLSVGDPANLNQALTQSIFVRERRDDETESLRTLLRGVSLAFIKQETPEADRYAAFLAPAYVQSFSTPTLKLRLNSELPPKVTNWLKMAALPMEQLVASTLSKQHADQQREGICDARLGCLLSSLPLVMFILPGGLTVSRRFFRRNRRTDRPKLP